ncbi:ATP-binding protein [Streptomyces sp. V4I2]|uniref:ATP-binding protein n=1 Tax=Streptomyces sp. V4I2 TaxID=3042280 RepID=UPI002782E3F2|nr:ATP-binding protein [Streptomyces sp. V4I2]MDQ1046544.1 anti-sigma regulatory factor (Ser/Thr protein kinase) [Streptomyces sp. V4I2]
MIQETAAPAAQSNHPVRNFSVQLSPTPRGARLARLLATEQLRAWEIPLDPARHLVAELAANAATHSRVPGRDFRVTLYVVADTLRIEVTDTCGDRLPQPQVPTPDAESGRGLLLVEALADRWGTAQGPHPRKTVWAELRLPPEHRNACSGDRGAFPKEPRR